jgi:hypothetical protein
VSGNQDATTKINTAYQFGYNRGNPAGVLIFKLCDEVYNELAGKGQILKRQIAGVPEHNETIFLPESFKTLNKEKIIANVITL